MKIVVASDSFKGSVTSLEAGQAIQTGLRQQDPAAQVEVVSIADGGEGSMAAIKLGLGGEIKSVQTVDLLSRPLTAEYLLTKFDDKRVGVIESATVLGLNLITPSPETIRQGTSYGLGLVLLDMLKEQVDRIVIFLGGTGTSDGGLGLLQALGGQVNCQQKSIEVTTNPLFTVTDLQIAQAVSVLQDVELFIGNDVTSPYYGQEGAAYIYAPQKGADAQQVEVLDAQMRQVANLLEASTHIDLEQISGSGAAGGLGGMLAVLGGKMLAGFDIISELIGFDQMLAGSDLIYTGEGQMDAQSAFGKLPMRVAEAGQKQQIPTIALVGSRKADIGQMNQYLLGAFAIQLGPESLQRSMEKATTEQGLSILAGETYKLFTKTIK